MDWRRKGENLWEFQLEEFRRITYESLSYYSEKMIVKCEQPQKFRLEFFQEDKNEDLPPHQREHMIRFRVHSVGGRLDLKMELSVMEWGYEGVVLKSSGWVDIRVADGFSSGSFDLLTSKELSAFYDQLEEYEEPLNFVCEVKTMPSDVGIRKFEDKAEGRARLGDDLAKARIPPLSDITLVCQGRSFAAHKVLLAARSDVFAAMFSHEGTLEASTGSVEIADMESGTVEQMIQFLYADELKGDGVSFESACKLLAGAHKYNILPLAAVCEHLISKAVAVETAVPALKVTHLYGSDSLKMFVVDFAMEHMAKLSRTSDWRSIVRAKDSVSKEIVKSIKGKATKGPARKRSRV